MRSFCPIVAACALSLAAACSGINDPSKNTIEDFTNTVEQFGGNVFVFDVNRNNGEYSATITALAPDPSTILSIYLGQDVGGLCTPILGQGPFQATLNRLALNSTITKGRYCIQVYDQGFIPRAETYTLRVSHP